MALGRPISEITASGQHPLLVAAPHWCRVCLRNIATIQNGFAFSSEHFTRSEGKPLIRIRDVRNHSTENFYNGEFDEEFIVRKGDLLIGMDGDFHAATWNGPDGLLNQRVCRVTPFTSWYSRSFLNLVLQPYLNAINAETSSVTVKHLSSRTVGDIPLPLPPLNEQKRIVAKIEELFSELDAGEESLRRARKQLTLYRQSLLKQAFEGKLTEEWRHTVFLDKLDTLLDSSASWKRLTVLDIGRIETGTTPSTSIPENYGGELPFLKPTDLEQGRSIRTARNSLSLKGRNIARVLPSGSTLVTCIGATIGKAGLCATECATNQQINSISPAPNISPEFVYFQVISPHFQTQIKRNASATTLPILNKSKFSSLEFILCALPEQQEIVRILDEQFDAIAQNEREIDAALKRSEALRQSILKKAFSGQLVPQDPNDESASELLARIQAERATSAKAPRKKRNAAAPTTL